MKLKGFRLASKLHLKNEKQNVAFDFEKQLSFMSRVQISPHQLLFSNICTLEFLYYESKSQLTSVLRF